MTAELDAVHLVRHYRDGALSPVDVAEAALERIAEHNPAVNAFARVTAKMALAQAVESERRWRAGDPAGPLDGVPVTVKDNLRVAGVPTVSGSATIPLDQPWDIDAPGVARLRAAGAVILGITTMPEFAWKVMTDCPLYGITRNPWDLDRTPGGSSGGSAAATAAGFGVLALATDGGGSIRVPASRCGLIGLKPTHGRVSDYPASAFGTNSNVGPIGRTAADVATMMNVIARRDARDWYSLPDDGVDYVAELGRGIDGARVGFSADLGSGLDIDPAVAAGTEAAAQGLRAAGAEIEEIAFDAELFGQLSYGYFVHRCVMQAAWVRSLPQSQLELMDQELRATCEENADRFSAIDVHRAEMQRRELGSRLNVLLENYDLIVAPTIHTLPERVEESAPHPLLTAVFNFSRHPAISVPAGLSPGGLPVGVQLIAGHYRDALLLRAAAALEQTLEIGRDLPKLL